MTQLSRAETNLLSPRQPGTGFFALVALFLLYIYLFSPLNLAVLGWFIEFDDGISHGVHEVSFGILFAWAFVGLVVQLRSPERNVAGALQAFLAVTVFSLLVTISTGFEPIVLSYFVPVIVIAALHPELRQPVKIALRPSRPLLALTLLGFFPLLAIASTEMDKATQQHAGHVAHWSAMAAFALVISAMALIASLRPIGWSITAWSVGVGSIIYGLVSLMFPADASATPLGFAVVVWGLLFIGVARRNRTPSIAGPSFLDQGIFRWSEAGRSAWSTPDNAPAVTLSGRILILARVAWTLVVVAALAMTIVGFVAVVDSGGGQLLVNGPFTVRPELTAQLESLFSVDFLFVTQILFHVLALVAFIATGALIFVQKSHDWMKVLSSALLVLLGVSLFAPLSLARTTYPRLRQPIDLIGIAGPNPKFWFSLSGLALILFAFLFPDGRFVHRWTRHLAKTVAIGVAYSFLFPGSALDSASWPGALQVVVGLGISLAVVAAQVDRYRNISGSEYRRQTRLVVLSLVAGMTVFVVLWLLTPTPGEGLYGLVVVTPRLEALYELNLILFLGAVVLLLPVSLAVSVIRYRLWDFPVVVSRVLIYGTLSAAVVGAFFVGVVMVSAIVEGAVGITGTVTGVAIALSIRPLHSSVQQRVDRRFYRRRYEVRQIVESFSRRLEDSLDGDLIESDLLNVIEEAIHPSEVAIVRRDTQPDRLNRLDSEGVLSAAGNYPIPIEWLDSSVDVDPWAETAVPLVSHGETIGTLLVGRRLSDHDLSDLDNTLLGNLASISAPALRFAELIREQETVAEEREGRRRELELASLIQRDLLPQDLPDLQGWQFAAHYEASREVGGDFYDFIEFPDGRWGLAVGDVTDKGIPAALVMAACRSMLRGVAQTEGGLAPGQVLRATNSLIHPDIPAGMFVTCLYAVLDPASGRVTYANAGHTLPYVLSEAGVVELRATGLPLGLFPVAEYEEFETVLDPGDVLLLQTDGLVEARNPDREMFGSPRLGRFLSQHARRPGLIEALLRELAAFTETNEAWDDDVTLVTTRRLGSESTRDLLDEFSVASASGNEREVIDRVAVAVSNLSLADRNLENLKMAVGEATMNAIEHGNQFRTDVPVEVRVRASKKTVVVEIVDRGGGHAIGSPPTPDLEAKLAGEQSPRGWGLFLIEHMVDEVKVETVGERRTVSLVVELERRGE
jgi:serine phosphatase RsbU (regulator of sigma subunit)/anti-sigma regulatory factor (Ser/Thr protein kinase)